MYILKILEVELNSYLYYIVAIKDRFSFFFTLKRADLTLFYIVVEVFSVFTLRDSRLRKCLIFAPQLCAQKAFFLPALAAYSGAADERANVEQVRKCNLTHRI